MKSLKITEFRFEQIFGALLFAIVTIFTLFFPFSFPNKVFVSLILGLLAYGLFGYYFGINTKFELILRFRRKIDYANFTILLLYIFSLAIILLPIHNYDSSFYLPWTKIDFLSYCRQFGSILLTSILPGYVLVTIIRRRYQKSKFSKTSVTLFSILVSLALTSFATSAHWLAMGGFNLLRYSLLSINVVFVTAFCIILLSEKKTSAENKEVLHSINSAAFYKTIITLSIIAFLAWVFLSTHSAPQSLNITYDEYSHVGLITQLVRGWQSWQSVETGSGIYPYFLHLVFLAADSLSGFPLFNSFLSFSFLLLLPVLSYYFMSQTIFGENRKSFLSTVLFSMCAGFGWIYANFLQRGLETTNEILSIFQASQITYDVIRSSWLPIYIAPYIVDVSIFFALVGLVFSKKFNKKILGFFIVLLTSFGVLIHVEKVMVFGFLLFFISFLYCLNYVKTFSYPKTILVSFIGGSSLAFIISIFAPINISHYVFSITPFTVFICIIGFGMIIFDEKFRLVQKMKFKVLKITRINIKSLLFFFAFFSYLILTVAFFYSYSNYSFNEQYVPIWFFPLKTGVVGLLALGGFFFDVHEKNRMTPALVLVVGILLLELVLYHSPFSLFSITFPEFRIIRDVLSAFLSLVAAYGLTKLFDRIKRSSRQRITTYFASCILILIIIVSSVPSHLLKVQYFGANQQIVTNEELDALNFLEKLSIPSGSHILTGFSRNKVYAVTGASTVDYYDPVFSTLIFNSKNPSTVLWTLNYLNISYVYMNIQDLEHLETKYANGYFNWLMPHLQLLFSNNAAKIYSIPTISPPMEEVNTKIVTGDLLAYSSEIERDFLWIAENQVTNWTLKTENNVGYSTFSDDGGILTLTGETLIDKQAAVFYNTIVAGNIQTSNSTYAIVKFKSHTSESFAIVDILYSDGETQRILYEGSGYMKSIEWATATILLQPNKSIKSIQLGITDNKKGNGETISCSFEYVGIARSDNPINYYEIPLFGSLMEIQYGTISEYDPSLFKCNTLIVADKDFSEVKLNEYIDWIKNGGSLVVFNNNGGGSFSKLLELNETYSQVLADAIVTYERVLEIPSIYISKFNLDDNAVNLIANYTFQEEIIAPFGLFKTLGEGNLIYLDINSIFQNFKGCEDLKRSAEWVRDLLMSYLPIQIFDRTSQERSFYVKNLGEITSQGETTITTSDIISGLENLHEIEIKFLNNTEQDFTTILKKVTLKKVERPYNYVESKIHVTGNTSFLPIDENDYIKLKLDGIVTFELLTESTNPLTLQIKNGNQSRLSFKDGIIKLALETNDLELVVRKADTINCGTTHFPSLFVSYPYDFQSSGNQGTFDGFLGFRIKTGEEETILIDDFETNASLLLTSEFASSFDVDFGFFIKYPYESGFFIIIIVMICLMINWKRKEK